MAQHKVAVVIPIYRDLTPLEKISFLQCTSILKDHPVFLVKPHSLQTDGALEYCKKICFDDLYFEGVEGYNKLMLSEVFYDAFEDYEYILIAQLDTFVIRDELLFWCSKGYDYIGAPWLHRKEYSNKLKATLAQFRSYLHTKFNLKQRASSLPSLRQFENKVGNGGFSLRRVNKFRTLCTRFSETIARYHQFNDHHFHEDVFWSIEVNRRKKILHIPSMKEALSFSFENFPGRALKLNGNKLPFGCHAWDKNLDFWKPIIESTGYTLDFE